MDWPMIWTADNETFMISVGWFPNDDVTNLQDYLIAR